MNDAPRDRYRRLANRFTELLHAVPESRWSAPTPCEGWGAIDVVDHVVATQLEFFQRQPFGADVDVAPPAENADPSEVVASWSVVRDHVQHALDDPSTAELEIQGFFGPTTFAATVDDFYNLDLVVHTWDIATAVGLTPFTTIDHDEIRHIRSVLEPVEAAMRQPGMFDAAIEVAPDADEQTRFLAFLGRPT